MSSASSTSNGYGGSNSEIKPEYIYEIPFAIRQKLCRQLDSLNLWEELAVNHFGFERSDLQRPRNAALKGNSPSDELLNMWGDYGNHKILELFVVFHRLKLYEQMEQIKSFVDKGYHCHIKISSNNLETREMKSGITKNIPDLNALLENSPSIKLNNLNSYDSNTDSYLVTDSSNTTSSISTHQGVEGKDKTSILNSKEVRHLVNQITIPRIDYNELKEATNDFNKKNSLGKGGFGQVYKGTWKQTRVAIKRLLINEGSSVTFEMSIKQILNELKFLNSCRHDNILSIYGYSIGENPCLVYQLMEGGSLYDHLSGKSDEKLTWSQRFTIAKETARGIQYLHTFQKSKPLIHGDIKPANILLDKCCQPKIGDFGLVREGLNSSVEVSAVFGTRPYLPQEYLLSKCLSTKIDTYSFGIVLLEIVTGLKVHDSKRQDKHLTDHVFNALKTTSLENLVDKNIAMEKNTMVICEFLVELGRTCVTSSPINRPEMVDITTKFDNFYVSGL